MMSMKKLLILFSLILILCGCANDEIEDEYANFTHYKSDDFVNMVYNQGYIIAYLPPASETGSTTLLLYQVGKDDYIYIDKISEFEIPNDNNHIQFYKNKLYIIGDRGSLVKEYVLDGINTKKGEYLHFDMSKLGGNSIIWSIKNIKDNYIYLDVSDYGNIKCSLESRICEL